METKVFAAPIQSGKREDWGRFVEELKGGRASEFADFNQRYGLRRHASWVQETPMGDVALVLHEGPGAGDVMGKLAASENEFDEWFKRQLKDIHGLDFAQAPPPPPELGVSWESQESS